MADFYKTHLSDSWATIRGPGRLLIAPFYIAIPDSLQDIINLATYDSVGGWEDLGATKGGISLGYEIDDEIPSIIQETGQIELDPVRHSLSLETNLAEATYTSVKYAWEASDLTEATENSYTVGTPHKATYKRACLLFKNREGLIRAYVVYRAKLNPRGSLTFNKSGDQVTIPVEISANPDFSQSDIKNRFMKIIEQDEASSTEEIVLI